MPAPPPEAVTSPPLMVTLPLSAFSPPPMPAPPPLVLAVTVPPLMVTPFRCLLKPPPIAALPTALMAVTLPPLMVMVLPPMPGARRLVCPLAP